jgi:hypothetical protein
MRVSVDRGDPAFHEACRGTKVLLDGEPCPAAITADEERGEVVVRVSGPDVKTLYGRVALELSPELQKLIGTK